MKRIIGFALCIFALMVVGGCSNPDAEFRQVSGVITYNGAPVEKAMVAFVPTDDSGIAATGMTDAAGKYTLTSTTAKRYGTGAKPGKYFVKVTKTDAPVDLDQEAFDKGEITYDELQERKAKKGPYTSMASKSLIPAKYANHLTSKLEATVENKKDNEFNFVLED